MVSLKLAYTSTDEMRRCSASMRFLMLSGTCSAILDLLAMRHSYAERISFAIVKRVLTLAIGGRIVRPSRSNRSV